MWRTEPYRTPWKKLRNKTPVSARLEPRHERGSFLVFTDESTGTRRAFPGWRPGASATIPAPIRRPFLNTHMQAIPPTIPELETPRLVLRRFEFDDAPFVMRLVNEPSFLFNNVRTAFVEMADEAADVLFVTGDDPCRKNDRIAR